MKDEIKNPITYSLTGEQCRDALDAWFSSVITRATSENNVLFYIPSWSNSLRDVVDARYMPENPQSALIYDNGSLFSREDGWRLWLGFIDLQTLYQFAGRNHPLTNHPNSPIGQ